MSTDLREELDALARTQSFSPDPTTWDRGRRARRRDRALAALAAVVVVAGLGGAALLSTSDRQARTASTDEVVEGGAIPSRIEDPGELDLETDLAVGRASVAFFSSAAQAVVIGATDGRHRALDLPDLSLDRGPLSLSPDGTLLAWRNGGRIHVLDLDDGTRAHYPSTREHADVSTLTWAPDSDRLLWNGTDDRGGKSGGVLTMSGQDSSSVLSPSALRGIPSPTGQLVAVASLRTDEDAATFVDRRGRTVGRALPADLYPDGAGVTPLGWAGDHLVVAQAYGPPGSYVEGQHLVLFTSPDRPRSEWTFRIVTRDVPQDAVPLSIAVDLVPGLDGTSSQRLTHDFSGPSGSDGPGWLPYGLGALLALLAALAFVRLRRHRA
ncbi:hypothetical protein GCM10011376_08110 [Nocardioides flavus (ex Wang et al. 2016)]|uniref:WD40 repeat domain-containing protein n=1 Tax=Nocardioides flavus (ex Wang et al. 2016) TaxID=2058780 RepID=A0ABQ3HHJ4_9ACTN|nr:hypothetical protein [Nocardioides flavus (ex Wang et al. 2016)]GHE16201.1 hypothetical protein GCM10011376_08110 [Nocardioides flavus (ex Wang et al. 2016)]